MYEICLSEDFNGGEVTAIFLLSLVKIFFPLGDNVTTLTSGAVGLFTITAEDDIVLAAVTVGLLTTIVGIETCGLVSIEDLFTVEYLFVVDDTELDLDKAITGGDEIEGRIVETDTLLEQEDIELLGLVTGMSNLLTGLTLHDFTGTEEEDDKVETILLSEQIVDEEAEEFETDTTCSGEFVLLLADVLSVKLLGIILSIDGKPDEYCGLETLLEGLLGIEEDDVLELLEEQDDLVELMDELDEMVEELTEQEEILDVDTICGVD